MTSPASTKLNVADKIAILPNFESIDLPYHGGHLNERSLYNYKYHVMTLSTSDIFIEINSKSVSYCLFNIKLLVAPILNPISL